MNKIQDKTAYNGMNCPVAREDIVWFEDKIQFFVMVNAFEDDMIVFKGDNKININTQWYGIFVHNGYYANEDDMEENYSK